MLLGNQDISDNKDIPLASKLKVISESVPKITKTQRTKEVYDYVIKVCTSAAKKKYNAVVFLPRHEPDPSLRFNQSDLEWLLENDGFETFGNFCVKWSGEESYNADPKRYYLSDFIVGNRADSTDA